jgi:group II intron reverse transcriptase/maturase
MENAVEIAVEHPVEKGRAIMTKSLVLPASSRAELQAPPAGPLQRVRPEALFAIDALRRAWLKVKAAGGGAGVDGVSLGQFEAKLEANLTALRADLLAGGYRPQPVKRLLVPKPNGGLRPLALWTLRDKLVQRVVYDCIEPYFESQFLACSFGFRPGRNISQVVQAIMAHRAAQRSWVADLDIKHCFDSLDSALLLDLVQRQVHDPMILGLIRAWLRAHVFNDLSGPQAEAGASQGAVLSPLLANIYLHQVDLQLTRQGYALIRYADDMVICCRRKLEAEQAMQATAAALQRMRLEINPHKSQVVHFDQGFRFVGVFFLRGEYFYL